MIPFASQKTVHITFLANKTVLIFFGNGSFQTIDFFFVLGGEVMHLCLISLNNPTQHFFTVTFVSLQKIKGGSHAICFVFRIVHTLINICESGTPNRRSLSFPNLVMLNNDLR